MYPFFPTGCAPRWRPPPGDPHQWPHRHDVERLQPHPHRSPASQL